MSDSDSSEEDLGDLSPFQRAVHADAYKRALVFEKQVAKYEATGERLDAVVDQMKLWVKNTATEYDPKREIQTFTVAVFPRTPIKELRVRRGGGAGEGWGAPQPRPLPCPLCHSNGLLLFPSPAPQQTIFSIMGFKPPVTRFGDDSDDEAAPPPPDEAAAKIQRLKLIYRGLVLEDGKVFDDYEWKKERWKWSKPYAGGGLLLLV